MTDTGNGELTFTRAQFEAASAIIGRHFAPSPQISWPLLNERCGCEVWVKHENVNPTGSFKVRGGLCYVENRVKTDTAIQGVVAATRGNHGQSVAYAAGQSSVPATLVVPHGNSREKNRAMAAYGAELIEYGNDFDDALIHARQIAEARDLHFFPSFHPLLVLGVGTYGIELLRAAPALDTVYVPIGMGSGICGMIAARDALNLSTEIVGVVAENAPAYARSFKNRRPIETPDANTLADGLAVRVPHPVALNQILRGASRIVAVSEADILDAIRHYFTDAHTLAEGAGASQLAALLKERARMRGKRVGLVISGGNIDRDLFCRALGGILK